MHVYSRYMTFCVSMCNFDLLVVSNIANQLVIGFERSKGYPTRQTKKKEKKRKKKERKKEKTNKHLKSYLLLILYTKVFDLL